MSFSLVTEPWIPCVTRDGRRVELGLAETFRRAHELVAVNDASPLVTLAIHRLILAFVHRVFGPSDLCVWRVLYERGSFDMTALDAYFDEQRERLDLLHPERPFYQVVDLPTNYEADELGKLLLERSNYGAPSKVFAHRPDNVRADERLPFSAATRHLIAFHAFAPGGLVRKPGEPSAASAGPMNRGAYVLVRGSTLFDTILLNLLVYDPSANAPTAGDSTLDCPAWEADPPPRAAGAQEPRRAPTGWLDLLTWQSRRVRLAARGSGVVGMVHCVGRGLTPDSVQDPMLAYRVDKTRGVVPVDFSPSRAVFRDAHSLVRHTSADGARCPKNVAQLAAPQLRGVVPRDVSIDVLGMRGDQAKILLSRTESFRVRRDLLENEEALAVLGEGLAAAESAVSELRSALFVAASETISPGPRDPDRGDISKVLETIAAEPSLWAMLGELFPGFLRTIADEPLPALEAWRLEVRHATMNVFERSLRKLGVFARHMQAAARAETLLRTRLRGLFGPQDAGGVS